MPKSRSNKSKLKKEIDKLSKVSGKDYGFYSVKLAQIRRRIKALQEKEAMLIEIRKTSLEKYRKYQKEYRIKRKKK